MQPIITKDFLSDEELQDIREKVFALKKFWITADETQRKYDTIPNFLPIGLYTAPMIGYKIYNEFLEKSRNIVKENFDVYHEKLRSKLCSVMHAEVSFHEELPPAGFHIFTAEKPAKNGFNFHYDSFVYKNFNALNDIKSVTIPIVIPKSGTGLHHFNDKGRMVKLNYHPGELIIFNGSSKHSIDEFILQDTDDIRMTMQCHLSWQKDKFIIFW